MRILLVYPGPLVSVIDVADGYVRALRALGHEVRPFEYHNWIRLYGAALGGSEGTTVPRNTSMVLASEHVVIEAVDFVPDVVLIMCGINLHRRAYELLDRLSLPMALLITESPYEDHCHVKIMHKGHIALAFVNERTSAPRLEEATGVPTTYLPHAYKKQVHKPMEVGPEYETDVFFHGTLWPHREELLDSIADLPYRIQFGGIDPRKGWDGKERTYSEAMALINGNTIDNVEMVRWYNGTRIAINHHREFCALSKSEGHIYLDNGEAESLGPRAFEIAACGAFQLCDDTRTELGDIFGDSVATYSNAEDLRQKIAYYMEHEDERQMMARQARERVRGCSYEDRAREIVAPALETIAVRR